MKYPRTPTRLVPPQRPIRTVTTRKKRRFPFAAAGIAILILFAGTMSLPIILATDITLAKRAAVDEASFPVTVDPSTKTINEDPAVEALLATAPSQLPASVGLVEKVFRKVALAVASLPIYQQLAGAAGAPTLFISIPAGFRQEQVATTFARELGWTTTERKQFITDAREFEPTLVQGSTVPGIYFASVNDPDDIAALVDDRFNEQLRSRYSTSTDAQVPIEQALTIASLLEREAGGWDDMRLISGIIWNRIFAGMKLQVDATLQYAEANQSAGAAGWWPSVEPKDKYIDSPYNTYQHYGLPPGPIANPSIAAVLAALNPKKTDCFFYFHDSLGQFHCSKTYAGHVALLKKYYGQGK